MKYYFFYVSFPIIDMEIDMSNAKHLMVIEQYRYLHRDNKVNTKSSVDRMRRLMKQAGLVDGDGNTGECGIHYIDLSFRECTTNELTWGNLRREVCKWCDVSDIK